MENKNIPRYPAELFRGILIRTGLESGFKSAAGFSITISFLLGIAIAIAGLVSNAIWLTVIGIATVLLGWLVGSSLFRKAEHQL